MLLWMLAVAAATEPPLAPAPFAAEIVALPAEVRAEMLGVSWREGCPVALDDLRLIRMNYWGYDGAVHAGGELVVGADVADAVAKAFGELYAAKFPIERMQRVDAFGGDDDRSMESNNTSAFNCRPVSGSSRWSMHAYGHAVDLNPLTNPFVRGDHVSPEAGRAYLDRTRTDQPGLIGADGTAVRAFRAIGWEWGGSWTSSQDFQHFSENGR